MNCVLEDFCRQDKGLPLVGGWPTKVHPVCEVARDRGGEGWGSLGRSWQQLYTSHQIPHLDWNVRLGRSGWPTIKAYLVYRTEAVMASVEEMLALCNLETTEKKTIPIHNLQKRFPIHNLETTTKDFPSWSQFTLAAEGHQWWVFGRCWHFVIWNHFPTIKGRVAQKVPDLWTLVCWEHRSTVLIRPTFN